MDYRRDFPHLGRLPLIRKRTPTLYPTRAELAAAFKRLSDYGIQIDGASDDGVSEAGYLHDPDNNGIELYWDRPLRMHTRPLNLDSLLGESSRIDYQKSSQ